MVPGQLFELPLDLPSTLVVNRMGGTCALFQKFRNERPFDTVNSLEKETYSAVRLAAGSDAYFDFSLEVAPPHT